MVLLFNKELDIDDWSVKQMNDCIQMTQIQISQSLIQLINVYVMTDKSQITLRSDSALEKILKLFDEECVYCLMISIYIIPSDKTSMYNVLMRQWELIDMMIDDSTRTMSDNQLEDHHLTRWSESENHYWSHFSHSWAL